MQPVVWRSLGMDKDNSISNKGPPFQPRFMHFSTFRHKFRFKPELVKVFRCRFRFLKETTQQKLM